MACDYKKMYRQTMDNWIKLAEAYTAIKTQNKELRKCLKYSEDFRKAYRKGKLELYAMGGEITEAAIKCLPCSEGPLERYSDKLIKNGGK